MAGMRMIKAFFLPLLLLAVWQRRRMSFILVTHNVAEAVFLGRFIMVMGGSPATRKLWIDNPCFGDASCRDSDTYFSVMRKVHEALELADSSASVKGCA